MRKLFVGIFFLAIYFFVSAVIYFFSAGRYDLPLAWFYFAANFSFGFVSSFFIHRASPDLIAERFRPGPGEQDRVFKIGIIILTIATLVLAGLDVGRYHWTGPVTLNAQLAALIVVFLGYALTHWAVLTNRFFSSAVRLQPDRHQVVVETGPYAYIRHPGYAGAIPYLALSGLALGSWLSTLVTAIPIILLTIRRTILEDAMLRKGLAGYEAYAARVKYRLLPGLW